MPTRRELANAIRALAMDAVQKANSGHPGAPMGMADIAEVLWRDILRAQPGQPRLGGPRPLRAVERPRLDAAVFAAAPDRLPAHARRPRAASASSAPTRPATRSVDPHLGIETTTGPLGQGIANAVGMALAEKLLAAAVQPPRPRHRRSPHLGVPRRRLPDGGHLARGLLARRHARARQADLLLRRQRHLDRRRGARLVHRRHAEALRGLRLAGRCRTSTATTPTPSTRRSSARQGRYARPTLICCKTVIGWGAPNKQGTESHARRSRWAPRKWPPTREKLGWTAPPFVVPDDIRAGWDRRGPGRGGRAGLAAALRAYRAAHPELAAEFERRMRGELPPSWQAPSCRRSSRPQVDKPAAVATRASSQEVLNVLGAGHARTARRLGRPHRLEQHQPQGCRARCTTRPTAATTSTTACASSAWPR